MNEGKITRDQLKRLQTLWGQYARNSSWDDGGREQRLSWASAITKRTITSFNDLRLSEASDLINLLQADMGIKESSPAVRKRRLRSRIKDRDQAHAAGTEGRRGQRDKFTIASAEDVAMIDSQLDAMGWNRVRLDALLNSSSSPLGRRSNPEIRTVGDVNRVLWALKRISRSAPKAEGSVGR
jgi:hypothetical protein